MFGVSLDSIRRALRNKGQAGFVWFALGGLTPAEMWKPARFFVVIARCALGYRSDIGFQFWANYRTHPGHGFGRKVELSDSGGIL